MLMQWPLDSPTGARASNERVLLMSGHLLEGLAGAFLIASVSLLTGLLRAAKASSRVTEENQDAPVHDDEQHVEGPQQPESLRPLQTAS
jgi:aspartate oxidase